MHLLVYLIQFYFVQYIATHLYTSCLFDSALLPIYLSSQSQLQINMLILSQHDIDAIVSTIPLHSLLINQQQAFANYSTNTAQCPQRTVIPTLHHNVLFMPSRGSESGTALKVVSVPTSKQGGLPATTMLLDEESGRVECLLNAKDLTAVRTAAVS